MLCICLVGGGGLSWQVLRMVILLRSECHGRGGGWGGGVAPSTSHACMVGRIPYSCNLSIHTFALYVAMIIHCQNCYCLFCRYCRLWMTSSRLTVNAKVASGLGSIPASSNTVEYKGRVEEAVLNNVHKKKKIIKNPPLKKDIIMIK
jgi:hypothetical protein